VKDRDRYLNKLVGLQDSELVKIITGVRRCGKSSLLSLYAAYLAAQGVAPEQIVSINFERQEFTHLQEYNSFLAHIDTCLQTDKPYYLLVDEVQELEEWAKAINSIRTSYDVDICVTGSNSRVFSGEHLTYLSGRYVELKLFPLSFKEWLRFKDYAVNADLEQHFGEYLQTGSFPALALTDNQEIIEAIASGLTDSVFSRDIILRGRIKDEGNFYKVAKHAFENIGNQTSAYALANTLKSQGHKISTDAVDNYLKLMCDAFLLYQCERYDIRGKERLRTNGKYYVVDTGLRNRLLGHRASDFGHVLENIVYLQLLRLGHTVSIGKTRNGEVDFVAIKGVDVSYYQVSQTVMDPNTLARELAAFASIDDNYPKYLVTMDRIDFSTRGIKHVYLLDFLLDE